MEMDDGRSPYVSMLFLPRTSRGCIPHCVCQRQRLGGLERPCLCRWLRREYAACPLPPGAARCAHTRLEGRSDLVVNHSR
eukprot:5169849-Prymnesium_polylepis.1